MVGWRLWPVVLVSGLLGQPYIRNLAASVAQLDARPTGDQKGAGSTPPGRQHSLVEIDLETFCGHSLPSADSMRTVVIFSKRICIILVKGLEA